VAVTLTADVLPLLPSPRRFQGVVVAGVFEDFSIGETSLLPGDIIYELNGQRIDNTESLRSTISSLERGSPGALLIERQGQLQFLVVELQ
jgi:S1-C subfamily serine protease